MKRICKSLHIVRGSVFRFLTRVIMYDRYSQKDSLLFLRNLAGTEDTKSLRCQWYVRSFSYVMLTSGN